MGRGDGMLLILLDKFFHLHPIIPPVQQNCSTDGF